MKKSSYSAYKNSFCPLRGDVYAKDLYKKTVILAEFLCNH